MKNILSNKIIGSTAIFLLILGIFVFLKPSQAEAFKLVRLIDPFCLTCGNNDAPQNVVNNVSNSNNTTNSNNSTVTNNGPVLGYNNTPIYPPNNSYNNYPSPLSASCYPVVSSVRVGDTANWNAVIYGGNGSNYVTWSGNDGLTGYGLSTSRTYYNVGSKYASITVTSGNQTITQNCISNIDVYDVNNYYNNNNNYNYNYNNNGYYNNYSQLYVSCYANNTSVNTGTNTTWRASASGGNGYFTYYWSGTDYLSGSGNLINVTYSSPGTKTATVTVNSNGQSITQTCSNSVNVAYPYYNNQNYNNNYYNNTNTGGLQVACYPNKVTAIVGSAVTWNQEAVGGNGNYSYSWTGSDGLSSNQSSVVMTYGSTGQKNATVTVTASNGQTITQSCGSTVNIINASQNVVSKATTKPTVASNTQNQNDSLSAASLFSLKNVPWGWVAVLVILVLMFTVLYLIFNRNKI